MNIQEALTGTNAGCRLLRLCAGSPFNADTGPRIRELIPSINDWDTLIAASIRHSVLPLLYEHLQRAGWESVPNSARQRLKNLHYKCTVRNTCLFAELNRILDLLSCAGLRALPRGVRRRRAPRLRLAPPHVRGARPGHGDGEAFVLH